MGRRVLLRQHRTKPGTLDYNSGHIGIRRLAYWKPTMLISKATVALTIAIILVLAVGCSGGGESSGSKPAQKGEIDDNLSAERHVKPGMTTSEVSSMIASPRPPWTTLNLKLREPSDIWGVKLDLPDGNNLMLTPIGADMVDSPYYAWIFFPTFSGSSPTTLVFFDATGDVVLHVQRYQCDDVLKTLAVGGQHTGVPPGSACHP